MSLELKVKKDLGKFKLDVELTARNEVVGLLGASGCGKSMTLRCIAGIVTPDEGCIVVDGVSNHYQSDCDYRRGAYRGSYKA